MNWPAWLDSLTLDVRYSLRTLAAQRGVTLVACLSLAIGIGANTAAFSVYDALLLRPLAVQDPDALALVTTRNTGSLRAMSHPSFVYLRDHSSALDGLAAFRATPVTSASAGGRSGSPACSCLATTSACSASRWRPARRFCLTTTGCRAAEARAGSWAS